LLPTAQAASAVAFFYGRDPPWRELQAFDLVVVDPDHVPDPGQPRLPQTRLLAYVSVGEVQPTRSYFRAMPPAWLVGENRDWGGRLIDQAAPGWPAFFLDKVIAPLWAAGYRGFFLDTLDAYQRFAVGAEARARQEAGLVELVRGIKRRYPEAQLIANRGFEILDRTADQLSAVAAESLYQGFDAAKQVFRPVPAADRDWLLAQLGKVRDTYRLPVIAIDYLPLAQRDLARETARRIEALGFIPWVAPPDLTAMGIGLVEAMPRRILMVHSPLANDYQLRRQDVVRFATMPVNYLGYAAEYVDSHHLPVEPLVGRYAGVVVWLSEPGSAADRRQLAEWLGKLADEGTPFVVINQTDVLLDGSLARQLGLAGGPAPTGNEPITIVERTPLIGFEREPHPQPSEFSVVRATGGRPLLTLAKGGARQVAAAIMPWGGYVMFPYAVATLPTDDESRWVIDPFAFLSEALRLPAMPVPDTTTESGRRLLMVHMDGDGFVSRAELPGRPFAGELVRDRVVRRYRLPMTMSIIEAELSPAGLYPKTSAQLEAVARDIFAAPNVEIASHSYSHPFNWRKAGATEAGEGYNLAVPGYRFDLQREIDGSIRYIDNRLAPPGKKVAMFLWTGDCIPGRDALAATERLGVANMNGGDTVATRSRPTLTQVEGLGVERNGLFQVFAPNQNENVYTNNWTGPFYGYERVIETFEFTDAPRRLKPIDIYFHSYLTTKPAGLQALDKVFAYALAQETTPVFASDYARQVLDFRTIAVARGSGGWRIRGAEHLRTLRLPATLGEPDIAASRAVAGFNRRGDVTYVHLAASSADLVLAPPATAPAGTTRLVSANGRIEAFERTPGGYRWRLAGEVPLAFTLANAERCRLTAGGREIKPVRRTGRHADFQLTDHVARPLEALCRP
jgi:uncharacterized protein (TIGR01370 family)